MSCKNCENVANRIRDLEGQVEALEAAVSDRDSEITSLEDEIASLETDLGEAREERDDFEKEANELQSQLDDAPHVEDLELDLIRERVEWERTQHALGKPVNVEVLFTAFAALSVAFGRQ